MEAQIPGTLRTVQVLRNQIDDLENKMRLRMIRLVGAPEGAEAGESRLSVCSGLLRSLGMNDFSCPYRVLVSHVPRQASDRVPSREGARSCIEELKPAHKPEPGSRTWHRLPPPS